MIETNDIQTLQQQPEGQQFDRKSFRIDDNIRLMHFSHNPKIAEFMQQYKLVEEFGEGVDRMFREMAEAGNPAPEYKQVEFMLKVRLNSALREENETTGKTGEKSTLKSTLESSLETESGQKKDQGTIKWPEKTGEKSREKSREKIVELIKLHPEITQSELAAEIHISVKGIEKQIRSLRELGLIRRVGPDKGGHWEVIEQNEKGGE